MTGGKRGVTNVRVKVFKSHDNRRRQRNRQGDCKAFYGCGATVVIVGRNKEKLESAAAEISSPRLECMQWDISDLSLCESNFKRSAPQARIISSTERGI